MNTAGDLRKEYEILDGNAKAMLNAMVDDPSNTELIAEAKEMINPVIQESKEKVAEVLNLLSENHIALAVERRFGAPMLGLQFHPEAVEHLSPQSEEASNFDYKGNKKIIDLFIQWAAVVARKETLLKQIKDMP